MLVDFARPGFGPGKTAPRFIEDLQFYVPNSSQNSLSDPPPRHDAPPSHTTSHKHKHSLVIIEQLTDLKPVAPDAPRVLATICESCLAHIEVELDITKRALLEPHICPYTAENPLHHLRHDPTKSKIIHDDGKPTGRGRHIDVFNCSARSCPALVTVIFKPPKLARHLIKLLTDNTVLRARLARAAQELQEPAPGITTDLPHHSLNTLSQYLANALKPEGSKAIPRKNHRYFKTLSDDCAEIFHMAHFTEELYDGGLHWLPPPIELVADKNSQVRRDLQEMLEETRILMDRHKGAKAAVRKNLTRAEKTLKELLGCLEYGQLTKRAQDISTPEHPSYGILGTVIDFPDRLLTWAFERQKECDPEQSPYYFECLQILAEGRRSESLQMEVAMLRSRGEFTYSDVLEAGKSLGIQDIEKADDELIVGIFKARLADAPKQEAQMREHLTILGKHRSSELILQTAQKAFSNAAGAYTWLGVPETTEDQFILSTYEVRIKDVPSDEIIAKEALRMIAEVRQSPLLLTFLETGTVYDLPPMDLNAAFAQFDITDHSLADDTIISVFSLRLSDAPSKLHDLRTALRIIGESRNSAKIRSFLQTGLTDTVEGSRRHEWPVGLENIGNTCYLNSLLQFYFTVKPLRDMILNIDQFEEGEITNEVVERKRVGGRKVSKEEIERAKKFVNHLRTLFQGMIVSETSAVTPAIDLAYLALVSSKEEAARRNSVVENDRPVIIVDADDEDAMDIDPLLSDVPVSTTIIPPVSDDTSENTLVGDAPMEELPPPYDGEKEDYVMIDQKVEQKPEDKENMTLDAPAVFEEPEQVGGPERVPLQEMDTSEKTPVGYSPLTPPPERTPPPVPPRPEYTKTAPADMQLMFGRQQDVTECIGNVMFQIEAAIKPSQVDENGEQVDLVKDYFYGKTKQTLKFPNSAEMRTKEELFSHLLVNVADGDRDLYTALDGSFDVEQVDLEGTEAKRYLAITHLPPILQIQVQRVQFDREKGSAYKSNSHLNFPETIYMDRYMDTDDNALKVRREESWKWKAELSALLKRKEVLTNTPINEDMNTILEATREFLEDASSIDPDLAVSSEVTYALEQRASAVKRELAAIETQLKDLNSRIAQQFTDLRKHPYRIHSVFIHRGSVSFGHYWIYIYDFQKGIFRKYNDQYVTAVDDVKEVFTHTGTQAPTPYFLVFVREDQSLSITEAVQRVQDTQQAEASAADAATEAVKA